MIKSIKELQVSKGVIGADGRRHQRLGEGHDCSCCGSRDNGEDWFVFKAGWCDSDGVYYAKLCGDFEGRGCIYEVDYPKSFKNEAAKVLQDMMPGEFADGVPSMLDELDYLGEFDE